MKKSDSSNLNRFELKIKDDVKSFLTDYIEYKESKLDGDLRVLERKDVWISDVVHIGKESNGLEESEILGLDEESYVEYFDVESMERKFRELAPKILELKPKDVKEFGISKQTLWNVKHKSKTKNFSRISNSVKYQLIRVVVMLF